MKGWEDNVNVEVWDVVDEGFMLDERGIRIKDTPITVKSPTSGDNKLSIARGHFEQVLGCHNNLLFSCFLCCNCGSHVYFLHRANNDWSAPS